MERLLYSLLRFSEVAPEELHWRFWLLFILVGPLSSVPFLGHFRPSLALKGPGVTVHMGCVEGWFIHKLKIRAMLDNCS